MLMKPMFHMLVCLVLSTNLLAYDPLDKDERNDYREPTETWKEEIIEIPSHFEADNLQEFNVQDPTDRFQFFIERDSLKTSKDRVTRFVVVIRSNRGAVNSSYEGFRCGLREHKVYAYGNDKGLTPMPGAEWQVLPKGGNDYKTILYEDLICNMLTGKANPPDTVFRAMRDNRLVDTPFLGSER
ncbi:MAG: CNP1-like family protein [Candidatus Thiodiazotropha sp. (ex Notomyrtea botanica)]|nr:CNP1-like family protein [Candidatus Thiodiazotropha sp. (ex Notomyrtea botanica)]